MPATLIRRMMEDARERDPAVRIMALLHGARVLAFVDLKSGRTAFAEALALTKTLQLDRLTHDCILMEAAKLGADADPAAAVALYRGSPPTHPPFLREAAGSRLVQALAKNGEIEAAVELLEDLSVPASGAMMLIAETSDLTLQRRAMAAAHERWRWPPGPTRRLRDGDPFFHLFSVHWQKLERAEQLSWLEEILREIEGESDERFPAGFGEVRLVSQSDAHLFEILNVLRALKPAPEVEAILRAHPGVSEGSRIYPLGLETLRAQRNTTNQGTAGGLTMAGGDGGIIHTMMAARRGEASAVDGLLAEAARVYEIETDPGSPHRAPCPFWPSCRAYRTAMYWAGNILGQAAEARLTEIPDPDLAIFAGIEIAAGMLELEPYFGIQMGGSSRRRR